ncbi:MAG: pyridoxamine 5'-phosphate oxidase family protein [Bacillota bacterium]
MFPEKLTEVLQHEGVVAIATQGQDGPHLVNSWNSYIQVTDDERLLIPAGGMKTTEANLNLNPHVLVTVGSRQVQGFHSMGTGFLIEGTATLPKDGPEFDRVKARFPWARAALVVKVAKATQTL